MHADRSGTRPALRLLLCLALTILAADTLPAQVKFGGIMVGPAGQFRPNHWVPISVDVQNLGDAYITGGTLVVEHDRNLSGSVVNRYTTKVDLPPHAVVRATVYGRLHAMRSNKLFVRFLDARGVKRAEDDKVVVTGQSTLLAVTVNDQPGGMEALANSVESLPMPYGNITLASMQVRDLPMRLVGYDSVGVVMLGQVNPEHIPAQSAGVMVDYVKQGGLLVVAMGRHYERYLGSFLEELLPVEPIGYRTFKRLDPLEKAAGARMSGPGHIDFCEAVVRPGATVHLRGEDYPSIVSWPVGMGRVVFLAFDLPQLETFAGRDWLRRTVLMHPGRPLRSGAGEFESKGRSYVTQMVGYRVVSLQTLGMLFGAYLAVMLVGLGLIHRAGHGEYGVALVLPMAIVLSLTLLIVSGAGSRTVPNTRVEMSSMVVPGGGVEGTVKTLVGLYASEITSEVTLHGSNAQTVFDQATGEEITVVCPSCKHVNVVDPAFPDPPRKPCYVCQSKFIRCQSCNEVIAVTENPDRAGTMCRECGHVPVSPKEKATSPLTVEFHQQAVVTVTDTVPSNSVKTYAARGLASLEGPIEASLKFAARGLEGTLINRTGYAFDDAFLVYNDLVLPIGEIAPGQTVDITSDTDAVRVGTAEYTSRTIRTAQDRLRMDIVRDLVGKIAPNNWQPGRPTFYGWHRKRQAGFGVTTEGDWTTDYQSLLVAGLSIEQAEPQQQLTVPAGVVTMHMTSTFMTSGLMDAQGRFAGSSQGQAMLIPDMYFPLIGYLDGMTPVSGRFVIDNYTMPYHKGDFQLYNVRTERFDRFGLNPAIEVADMAPYFDPKTRSIRVRIAIRPDPDKAPTGRGDFGLEVDRGWTLDRPQLQLLVNAKETRE